MRLLLLVVLWLLILLLVGLLFLLLLAVRLLLLVVPLRLLPIMCLLLLRLPTAVLSISWFKALMPRRLACRVALVRNRPIHGATCCLLAAAEVDEFPYNSYQGKYGQDNHRIRLSRKGRRGSPTPPRQAGGGMEL
jgi:hypothetical protein